MLGRHKYIAFSLTLLITYLIPSPVLALSYDEIMLLVQAERKVFGQANNNQSFDDRLKALEVNQLGGSSSGSESSRLKAVCRKLGILPAEAEPATAKKDSKQESLEKKAKDKARAKERLDALSAAKEASLAKGSGIAAESKDHSLKHFEQMLAKHGSDEASANEKKQKEAAQKTALAEKQKKELAAKSAAVEKQKQELAEKAALVEKQKQQLAEKAAFAEKQKQQLVEKTALNERQKQLEEKAAIQQKAEAEAAKNSARSTNDPATTSAPNSTESPENKTGSTPASTSTGDGTDAATPATAGSAGGSIFGYVLIAGAVILGLGFGLFLIIRKGQERNGNEFSTEEDYDSGFPHRPNSSTSNISPRKSRDRDEQTVRGTFAAHQSAPLNQDSSSRNEQAQSNYSNGAPTQNQQTDFQNAQRPNSQNPELIPNATALTTGSHPAIAEPDAHSFSIVHLSPTQQQKTLSNQNEKIESPTFAELERKDPSSRPPQLLANRDTAPMDAGQKAAENVNSQSLSPQRAAALKMSTGTAPMDHAESVTPNGANRPKQSQPPQAQPQPPQTQQQPSTHPQPSQAQAQVSQSPQTQSSQSQSQSQPQPRQLAEPQYYAQASAPVSASPQQNQYQQPDSEPQYYSQATPAPSQEQFQQRAAEPQYYAQATPPPAQEQLQQRTAEPQYYAPATPPTSQEQVQQRAAEPQYNAQATPPQSQEQFQQTSAEPQYAQVTPPPPQEQFQQRGSDLHHFAEAAMQAAQEHFPQQAIAAQQANGQGLQQQFQQGVPLQYNEPANPGSAAAQPQMQPQAPGPTPLFRTANDCLPEGAKSAVRYKYCVACGALFPLETQLCDYDRGELMLCELSPEILAAYSDRYEIISVLGSGGMGVVYRAIHKLLGKPVAIKELDAGLMGNATAMKRFQREAQLLSRINHPNVIMVHDFGITSDKQPYMVMDFANGNNLADVLDVIVNMPLARAKRILLQCASGLGHAHQLGIVHRDVKPQNIILDKDQDGDDLVKIVDFGIAKATQERADKLTRSGEIFGTTSYMSPEQCRGMDVDPRSDVFALGCVMFEILTGLPPFVGEDDLETFQLIASADTPTMAERRPDLKFTDEAEYVVQKALEKDADLRYQSMNDLIKDLARMRA